MAEIKPPLVLVEELGNAYKDCLIETRQLVTLAYISGYNDCANSQYRKLCSTLLQAIDLGNPEAEELALCQIRTALKLETQ